MRKYFLSISATLLLCVTTIGKGDQSSVLDYRIAEFNIAKGSTGAEVLDALLKVIRPDRRIYAKLQIHDKPILSDGQELHVDLKFADITLRRLLEIITTHMKWSYRFGLSDDEKTIHTIHIYRWSDYTGVP